MSSDTGYQMDSELERWLARLRPGHHFWLIYEDAGKQMATIAPFMQEGFSQGERCVWIRPCSSPPQTAVV